MTTYIAGFTLGLSLILAIGAQNAFVLKQGLKKQHVFLVCIICALSDGLLIAAGVSGFGLVVQKYAWIETLARYAGAAFLIAYALMSFRSALTVVHAQDLAADSNTSASAAALTCLAFTWLNPHVYLDTMVLLGSISTQYQPHTKEFGAGAITASFVFFFALGYGARYLIPIFQKPKAWQVLELIIGIVMLGIAISLLIA